MKKPYEILLKILNCEIQVNFTNRTIIGGLDKFFPNWEKEAIAENIPGDLISEIQSHCLGYSDMPVSERETSTREILRKVRDLNHSQPTETSNNQVITQKPAFDPTPPEPPNQQVINTPSRGIEGNHSSSLGMESSVKVLNGVGDVKEELFRSVGVTRIKDLFYFFPRRYDDFSQLKPINRIEYDDELTVIATVQSFLTTPIKAKNQARVEVIVSDGTGFLRLVFFRSLKYIHSFENHFRRGTQLVISGKVNMYLGRKQITNPAIEHLDDLHLNTNGIIPVYSLTAGLTQKDIRLATRNAINFYINKIGDPLPSTIRQAANLVDLPVALHQIHFPDSQSLLRSAQERLAFDEIFYLQLGVQQQKQAWHSENATVYSLSEDQYQQFTATLPYTLTAAQGKVIEEIRKDLASGYPMNRLIQGDVGSGKTIVAAIASLAINLGGGQTAFLAPTSILAEQHYQTLTRVLESQTAETPVLPLGSVRLLTGDSTAQERESINNGLQDGSIKLLVGTHALLEEPVQFKNLQLAIIDEQHRFGIAQRSTLRQKGENPHLLVMSATPIPRSLALTIFGDLDISVIDEMPQGRIPVETQLLHPFVREKAYKQINAEIEKGHQVFIVYPLIEKGDVEDQKAAVDEHAYLQKEVFPQHKLGLLHGRMPPDEKEAIMRRFRDGEYQILVSTTVIEVGVDVPNATIMLIESANRFGLAQLHQLRGRVGRGTAQSYCLLIPEDENAYENERLAAMVATNDGFILAEKDLQQRGPGDFIGYRQSGFADLKLANLTDIRLIEKARHFAEVVFQEDPNLEKPENQGLASRLSELWQTQNSDIS